MQVVVGRGHFRTAFLGRISEWTFATVLLMWGVVLLFPAPTFENVAYEAFRMLMEQGAWGVVLLLGGVLRLAVLLANGAWRPMYYVRAAMALSSMMVWLTITLGFASSGVFGTWLAVYPVMTVFEAVNVFRAMIDAAQVEREARKASPQ